MSTREVTLDGGSPWGFRMHGGADVTQPLRISRVNPGSKAAQKGIREGDLISSINGQSTRGVTNSEAHALLRNAGETLTLGLNQECSGSPKRRAQRLLEHKEDSTEKSNTSTTTATYTTVVNRITTNSSENTESKVIYSEIHDYKTTEGEKIKSKPAGHLSNGTFSETRGSIADRLAPDDITCDHPDVVSSSAASVILKQAADKVLDAVMMADNVSGSSRTRRQRRARSNRKKSKKCSVIRDSSAVTDMVEQVTVCDDKSCDNDIIKDNIAAEICSVTHVNYRVDSPKTVQENKTQNMVKSRSLDDDEAVKITEVTDKEVSEDKNVVESVAIVSEAESDVEWEVAEDLTTTDESPMHGKLSIISLPLEESRIEETSHISPEEEKNLRDFLEQLNLVASPEDSLKRIDQNISAENFKSKKARKRAAIAQHFLPYMHNPRYLEVISEEGSDSSDQTERASKDNPYLIGHNARPLLVYPQWYDDDDDNVFEETPKTELLRNKYETKQIHHEAILVGTKLVDIQSDVPNIIDSESIACPWTTTMAQCSSGAEVVYLEDSSTSRTPSDVLEQEEATDADAEDEESDFNKSVDDIDSFSVDVPKIKNDDNTENEDSDLCKSVEELENLSVDMLEVKKGIEKQVTNLEQTVGNDNNLEIGIDSQNNEGVKQSSENISYLTETFEVKEEKISEKEVCLNKPMNDAEDTSTDTIELKEETKIQETDNLLTVFEISDDVKNQNLKEPGDNTKESTTEMFETGSTENKQSSSSAENVSLSTETLVMISDDVKNQNLKEPEDNTKKSTTVVFETGSTENKQSSSSAENVSLSTETFELKEEVKKIEEIRIETCVKITEKKSIDVSKATKKTEEIWVEKVGTEKEETNTKESDVKNSVEDINLPNKISESRDDKNKILEIPIKVNEDVTDTRKDKEIEEDDLNVSAKDLNNLLTKTSESSASTEKDIIKECIKAEEPTDAFEVTKSDRYEMSSKDTNNLSSKTSDSSFNVQNEEVTRKSVKGFDNTSTFETKEEVIKIESYSVKNPSKNINNLSTKTSNLKNTETTKESIKENSSTNVFELRKEATKTEKGLKKSTKGNEYIETKIFERSYDNKKHFESNLSKSLEDINFVSDKISEIRSNSEKKEEKHINQSLKDLSAEISKIKIDNTKTKETDLINPTVKIPEVIHMDTNFSQINIPEKDIQSSKKTEDNNMKKEVTYTAQVIETNNELSPDISKIRNNSRVELDEKTKSISLSPAVPTIVDNDSNNQENEHSSLLNNIITALSTGNKKEIDSCISDEKYKDFPPGIKKTVQTTLAASSENIRDLSNKSPNDDEFNKEFKSFCKELNKTSEEPFGESRPGSSSSDRSSRSTSQCTALYNPINSSLTNIAEILRAGSSDEKTFIQPQTLKELCVQTLLKMPFGTEVIEELANVSLSIEEMTDLNNPNLKHLPVHQNNLTKLDNSCYTADTGMAKSRGAEKWVGMPTEEDPSVLVCLSPSQKNFIDTVKTVPKEADSLLDLHRKFIERKIYSTDESHTPNAPVCDLEISFGRKKQFNNLHPISEENKIDPTRTLPYIDYHTYVKGFTREKSLSLPNVSLRPPVKEGNINYNSYIKQITREVPIEVEKQMHKPVNNLVYNTETPYFIPIQMETSPVDEDSKEQADSWLTTWNTTTHSKIRAPMMKLTKQHSHDGTSETKAGTTRRRHSLPNELYEKQMKYILDQEREIQEEIRRLEEEKEKLEKDEPLIDTGLGAPIPREFDAGQYQISKKGDIAILQSELPRSLPTPSEKFRQKMYNEWQNKVVEREERIQHKVIKISSKTVHSETEAKQIPGIEDEFMVKVKQRMDKLGLNENEEETEENNTKSKEDTDEAAPILVMDGETLSEPKILPKHLQEFVEYVRSSEPNGVWSPNKSTDIRTFQNETVEKSKEASPPKEQKNDEPVPVVWTPQSAGSSPTADRKEFRPIGFESPTLGRKNKSKETTPVATPESSVSVPPPWDKPENQEAAASQTSQSQERRLPTSHSAPSTGLSVLATGSKLPRAQNPTITLLQKAREGQLPRGASYIEDQPQQKHQRPTTKDERPPLIGPHDIPVYTIKSEYLTETDSDKPKKMADLGPRKFEGIGPTTKDGMPIVLRSEVKDSHQAKWYKRMYDTLHRAKNDNEFVTVRYKTRRGRYPYTSAGGYLSEPEPNAYDSDASLSASKYATLDRRRMLATKDKENEYITYTIPRNNRYMSASVKHSNDVYKNQPGRIEDYVPGHSSISEKEAKEHLEQQKHVPQSKSYMSHALKESGYESDSTLVFRRRDDTALQLNPVEQKQAYKDIQRGGEVPLHGLRKPAPERPKEPIPGPIPPPKGQPSHRDVDLESPRKYVENEVTIHYRSPVRHEIKEVLSEEELARRQAEAMRRIYQEERRRKYLQELQDMNSRRHTDNFIPSQKSPIPLNRYDDFFDDLSPKPRDSSPEPRLIAKALYNFVGQTSRELTFRKGDIIFVRRQVDKNWYEGEHNAMVGLFPANYVEIVPFDGSRSTPRKAHEGQARAKFHFIAQTQLELSLAKGELVVLTRRVDDNWFEGRVGNRKGIFPVSYVEVLIDPSDAKAEVVSSTKPVASPAAHSLLLNGSAGGKESMGSHHYQPSYSRIQSNASGSYHAKPATVTPGGSAGRNQRTPPMNEVLHIDTHSEPVPYRALYKYRPQNDDELELQEGDTVFVLEKCDDGWYVGSSQRTGAFGTFPGNYVERI